MSYRSFIFCDRCNPQGIRNIKNDPKEPKRRISDERSWFEGTPEEAKKEGWRIGTSTHTCPRCVAATTERDSKSSDKKPSKFKLIQGLKKDDDKK